MSNSLLLNIYNHSQIPQLPQLHIQQQRAIAYIHISSHHILITGLKDLQSITHHVYPIAYQPYNNQYSNLHFTNTQSTN